MSFFIDTAKDEKGNPEYVVHMPEPIMMILRQPLIDFFNKAFADAKTTLEELLKDYNQHPTNDKWIMVNSFQKSMASFYEIKRAFEKTYIMHEHDTEPQKENC